MEKGAKAHLKELQQELARERKRCREQIVSNNSIFWRQELDKGNYAVQAVREYRKQNDL